MFNKIALKLVNYLLNKDLSIEQRNFLTNVILDNLDALPIRGIIEANDAGEILINGGSLDIEKVKQVREAARIADDSPVLKLIREQVTYTAIVNGINKATTPENMNFYKAAVWFGQEEDRIIKLLAQRTEE